MAGRLVTKLLYRVQAKPFEPMSLEKLITSILREPLFGRKDLARRYRVSVDTIDDWRRNGILPKPVHVGRFPYWRANEIYDREESSRKLAR